MKNMVNLKNIATAVYVLQAISFFLGITFIIGVIINYVKREDVRGTWLESHFNWQIKTFWIGILVAVLGGITIILGIGYLILLGNSVWIIYRIVKGWLCLAEGKAI